MTLYVLSEPVAVAIISSVPPTLAACAALVISLRNGRHVNSLTIRVEEVHKATNSLADRLVEATRAAAHAAGRREGLEERGP